MFLHDNIHIRFIIPITYITADTAISTFFLIHLYRNLSIGNRHLNMYFPIRSRLYFFFLTGGRRCYQLFDIKKLITPPTSGEEEEIQPAPDGEIHIEVPVPDRQITVEVDKEESGNSGIGGDIGDWDDETNVDIIV